MRCLNNFFGDTCFTKGVKWNYFTYNILYNQSKFAVFSVVFSWEMFSLYFIKNVFSQSIAETKFVIENICSGLFVENFFTLWRVLILWSNQNQKKNTKFENQWLLCFAQNLKLIIRFLLNFIFMNKLSICILWCNQIKA